MRRGVTSARGRIGLKPAPGVSFFRRMKVECECGASGEDYLSTLRAAGWVQPRGVRTKWFCPACVERRETMPTQAEGRALPRDAGNARER